MQELNRLVVFSIFMENNQGIVGKSPNYIMEKWHLVNADISDNYIIAGLDDINQSKYSDWQKLWQEGDNNA